ncbi:hypothetical protein NPIL_223661 [Nephila pilipes]|uniref:Uncharacterized protein n=1 Tax=Nephila pilipes TaxID=299642 RepID=A0A8X6Q3G1_NEPPI|nr:hypothetical protein NPIL_223661 [Nephila pilipes]
MSLVSQWLLPLYPWTVKGTSPGKFAVLVTLYEVEFRDMVDNFSITANGILTGLPAFATEIGVLVVFAITFTSKAEDKNSFPLCSLGVFGICFRLTTYTSVTESTRAWTSFPVIVIFNYTLIEIQRRAFDCCDELIAQISFQCFYFFLKE